MANLDDENDDRLAVRRGSEHVRIKGTTEELGEIVPPPVEIEEDQPQVSQREKQPS
jgi:hypothetical protein